MHKDHYDDAHMLCKVLDSMAAMAIDLKCKIEEGHQLPSWAEYKVYKAGDSIKSALSSTYSMKGHMPASIAIQKIASRRHQVMDKTKEGLLSLIGKKGKTGKLEGNLKNIVEEQHIRNLRDPAIYHKNFNPKATAEERAVMADQLRREQSDKFSIARSKLIDRQSDLKFRDPGHTRARIKRKMFKR